jgi:hypothetical protein
MNFLRSAATKGLPKQQFLSVGQKRHMGVKKNPAFVGCFCYL